VYTVHNIWLGGDYHEVEATPTLGHLDEKFRVLAFLSYQVFTFPWLSLSFCRAKSFALRNLSRTSDTHVRTPSDTSSANHTPLRSFSGPRGIWPDTNLNGLNPNDSWTDSLTANSSSGIAVEGLHPILSSVSSMLSTCFSTSGGTSPMHLVIVGDMQLTSSA